jgi:ssDNA-binding Zn-finger/Zn-ribbon topoisomerase 1
MAKKSKKITPAKKVSEKSESLIPLCPYCNKDGLYKFGAENGKTWYSCRQCGKKCLL